MDEMPASCNHTLSVPGLIDMAAPAFEAPVAWTRSKKDFDIFNDIPEDRREFY